VTQKPSITFVLLKDGLVVIKYYFFYTPEGCLIFRAWKRHMGRIFTWKVSCRSSTATIKWGDGIINC